MLKLTYQVLFHLSAINIIVRRKRAKKGPEVEVEYVQTFIAVYCSRGCVP